MIRLQDIRQTLTEIKTLVEKKVFDSYLLKFIKTPVIDEDKLLILITILDQIELSFSEKKNFALSTMLVQIALDTHEYMSNESLDEKNRQLTVLAGDYFSGLYYKLLSDSEDISMIRTLSFGIKEVNENKIRVYREESSDVDKLMKSLMAIESSLIIKLAEYFQLNSWNEYFSHFLFFKRLLNEKDKFLQEGSSLLFDALKRTFQINGKVMADKQKHYLLTVCDQYLEHSKRMIEKGIHQIPDLNELLFERIAILLKQHRLLAKSFVEEG